ncbi:hypothetical protein ACQPYK_41265 [Streptosporangium sp. CA-135522]|uniref:hypothetical protein n=1 Tax=Streptosporangium sp. CA-135522 TaxID=3240072 RepID=UPI003D89F134
MALELDPNWPGLNDNNGVPELNRTEIKNIAGEIQKLLGTLTTPSQPSQTPTAVMYAKGSTPPPLTPPGAGSLPDLQKYGAVSDLHMGEWPVAQEFARAVTSAYTALVGEPGMSGGARYASQIEECQKAINGLFETAKNYDGAEALN